MRHYRAPNRILAGDPFRDGEQDRERGAATGGFRRDLGSGGSAVGLGKAVAVVCGPARRLGGYGEPPLSLDRS